MSENSDLGSEREYDRGNPLAAEVEEATLNADRESALKFMRFLTRSLAYINAHRDNILLVWDCWLLATEHYDILGVNNQVALAARHNCDKANVSKIVKQIQRRTELTALSQRSMTGCKNMSRTRNKGLKP